MRSNRRAGRGRDSSANASPAELIRIEPRLAEILRRGFRSKWNSPIRSARPLLHALAKRRNWTLDDDAARVLATHDGKKHRELEALLKRSQSPARRGAVIVEIALTCLRDLVICAADRIARGRSGRVRQAMNVSADDMRSSNASRTSLCAPRRDALAST